MAPTPPFPQFCRACDGTLRFLRVVHPKQFEHGIVKEEPAIRCPLSGVHVARAFSQAKVSELVRYRRADVCTDQDVIEFKKRHSSYRRRDFEVHKNMSCVSGTF